MTTKTVSEKKAIEPHSALPWRVEEGHWANEGMIFIEADDPLNHYKQHVARLGYAFDRQGNDLRKENAEFICRAVNSYPRFLETLEALREWVIDPIPCASNTGRNAGENGNCDCWACERTNKAKEIIGKF